MWLLRLLAVILVVAIGAGLLIYVITGKPRHLPEKRVKAWLT